MIKSSNLIEVMLLVTIGPYQRPKMSYTSHSICIDQPLSGTTIGGRVLCAIAPLIVDDSGKAIAFAISSKFFKDNNYHACRYRAVA